MTVISAWWRSDMPFKRLVGDWVGVELLYNSVKTEVRQLELQMECKRRDVVATPGRRGPRGPRLSWGPEKLQIRCGRESHSRPKGPSEPLTVFGDSLVTRCGRESPHPAEWASGPPVEHQKNEKDTTLMAIRVESKYCSFCSVSNSLSQ